MAVPVEKALAAEGIPHIRCSRQSFFERDTVRRARAWLRCVSGSPNPADYSSALGWPNRYLRKELLGELETSTEFLSALTESHDIGLRWLEDWAARLPNETNRHAVVEFITVVRTAQTSRAPGAILERLGLRAAAENETAPAGEAPPEIVIDIIRRLSEQFSSVDDLEGWIATRGYDKDYAIGEDDVASVASQAGKVTLATIHQVKGQEFRAVAVLGPLDGMPDKRAREIEEIEEERRVAYVAVTRAQERLLFCASHKYADELDASADGVTWADYRHGASSPAA
jgi:superfamily I DNA/RNA helicase